LQPTQEGEPAASELGNPARASERARQLTIRWEIAVPDRKALTQIEPDLSGLSSAAFIDLASTGFLHETLNANLDC
jgi:hypothetical protein